MKRISIKKAEKALNWPVARWEANCFAVASQFVEKGLVEGVAVYGHWVGPIHPESIFYKNSAMFARHGWVILSDERICDPTRWCFEHVKPYVYIGASDHYDEGGNKFREAQWPYPPAFDFSDEEEIVRIDKSVLPSSAAWNRVERLLQLSQYFSYKCYEPGDVTKEQLAWLAGRSPQTLGRHVVDIYKALKQLRLLAFVPIDNMRMVERIYKIKIDT